MSLWRYSRVRKLLPASLSIFFFSSAQAQTWQLNSFFPGISRDDAVAEVVNDRIYFGTGFGTGFVCLNDWWGYDFKNNSWIQLNALPASPRQYASSCVYEEKIFIAGGVLGTGVTTSEIWSYNTQNDTWVFETSFPGGGRQAPVLLCLYDKMYMGLGRNDTVYYNDWWMYDLHEKNWISLAQVPFNARFDAEGIEMAGTGFVGLGKNSLQCFSDWWAFDPLTNEWQQKQSFPGNSCSYTSGSTAGEWIMIYGGTGFSNSFSNECFLYYPFSNAWSSINPVPGNPLKGGSLVSYSGDYYYISGIDSANFRTPDVWKLFFSQSVFADVNYYPNPAENWLCIASDIDYSADYILDIYSIMNGWYSFAGTIKNFKTCFNINDLASGFYLARLRKGNEYFQSFRFLKQ